METNSAVEYAVIKPEYKSDQEKVLDGIKVFDIGDIENKNYKTIINDNKDFYGFKSYKTDEKFSNDRIIFEKGKNNTGMVLTLNNFNGNNVVHDCVLLDFEKNKAFELNDLKTIKGSESDLGYASVFYKNNVLMSSFFKPEKAQNSFLQPEKKIKMGGKVVWNDNEVQKKFIDLKFGKGVGNCMSFLSLFHEFGHRYQLNMSDSGEKFNSEKELKNNFRKNENNEKMSDDKQKIKETERNAWAFSFAVTRKLKDGGLDLTRDLEVKKINSAVDLALRTYDISLRNIDGNEISNKSRAKARKEFTAE